MSLIPSHIRKRIEADLESALHPKGMSPHIGRGAFYAHDVQRLLAAIDKLEQPPSDCREIERLLGSDPAGGSVGDMLTEAANLLVGCGGGPLADRLAAVAAAFYCVEHAEDAHATRCTGDDGLCPDPTLCDNLGHCHNGGEARRRRIYVAENQKPSARGDGIWACKCGARNVGGNTNCRKCTGPAPAIANSPQPGGTV